MPDKSPKTRSVYDTDVFYTSLLFKRDSPDTGLSRHTNDR